MATVPSNGLVGRLPIQEPAESFQFCPFFVDVKSMDEITAKNIGRVNTWEIIIAIDEARKTLNLYCLMQNKRFESIVVLNTKKAQTLYKTQFVDFCEYFRINLNDSKKYIRHPDGGLICVVVL